MNTIKPLVYMKILLTIDVDDPESNKTAIRYAATQAKEFDAELDIGSVFERNDLSILDAIDPEVITAKRKNLVAVVQKYVEMAKDFGVEKVVGMTSEGEGIVNEILDAIIPDTGPDLLVCGADADGEHHYSSISIKLAKKAKISVIVVR